MTEKDFHPVAGIWPLMTGDRFQELVDDIMLHGLLIPIWRHEGKIIDGRNRFLACMKGGVSPRFQEWDGKGSLVEFVVSLNEKRRHQNESQRAMVAAKIANLEWGEKKKENEERTTVHSAPAQVTNMEAAKLMNVSERTVRRARRIQKSAIPEIVKMVESGDIPVTIGEVAAQADEADQRKAIKQGVDGVKALAKDNSPKKKTGSDPVEQKKEHIEGEIRGVGITRAHEAINCLTRIPKNDALRKRGFQVVTDWISHNS